MVDSGDLDALEQRQLDLENNVVELQNSLYHWRTWEAEYVDFRDKVSEMNEDATLEQFLAAGNAFGGSLVDVDEVHNIIVSHDARTRAQVVDALARRIDYAKQNVATIDKRLRAAVRELLAHVNDNNMFPLDVSDQQDPDSGTASFPVMEIMEELDEEDNVVSSSVNAPGDQASQLLEALKKAGVEDIPEDVTTKEVSTEATATTAKPKDNKAPTEGRTKKSEAGNDQPPKPAQSDELVTHEEIERDLAQPISLVTPEDRNQGYVTEVDESLEDAKLRSEILQYGIEEVGAIVAELEMDEEGSEVSIDEDDYSTTEEISEDEDEDEDEFGRSHTFLSEDYHQQMQQLEAKLNARSMLNVGKDADAFPEDVRQEIEQSSIPTETQPKADVKDSPKDEKPKKRVAFADELDIAPATKPDILPTTEKRTLPPQSEVPVLSDSVVERTDRTQETRQTSGPKKVSRFKSARSTTSTDEPVHQSSSENNPNPSNLAPSQPMRKQTNTIPSRTPPELFPAKPQDPKPFSTPITESPKPSVPRPPKGKTLADYLVEREVDSNVSAPEPDELDEEAHRRQIATEFFMAENRRRLQEEGITAEQEIVPLDTDDQPRISKFMAARMR